MTNVLFVGVGGQGTLVASKIMVEALLKAGFDVKKSEIHGMAQRGGSVISQVRFGPVVYSPLIRYGEGDIMVSFEQLEALRYLDYLHRDSLIFLNDQKILPPSVSMGIEVYPENIFTTLKSRFKNTFLIEGLQVAQNAGNARVLNIVLLGVLSRHLALDEKTWIETLREKLPPSLIDVNVRGFLLGREYEPAAVS
ncbi:MAG: indolepyruvate oxidoreductase subunit beta [Deltaproteobacteria bacterium]|nr:indolepyruvate oxidoreductase subunit beta [Deltaproteobacteria bacterium]